MKSKLLEQKRCSALMQARHGWIAGLLLATTSPVAAVDASLSGFATVGHAVSDQDQPYLRYIDKSGSWKADSLLGLQLDLTFDPMWGATVQAVAGAPKDKDDGTAADISWAFLSFRPTNDWLLRAGKLRSPYFIHAMNAEVGITYDQARLPSELYNTSASSYDYLGANLTKTWLLSSGEMSLDLFYADEFASKKARVFYRSTGEADWFDFKINGEGAVLAYTQEELMLRAGYAHLHGGQVYTTLEPVAVPGGGTTFVPSGTAKNLDAEIAILGFDWHPGGVWRVTSEYIAMAVSGKLGASSGYITLARHIGDWTPYITYSRTNPTAETKRLYEDLNTTPVPAALLPITGPTYHQDLADGLGVVDQWTGALGVAYQLSATSKIKAEWARTEVGVTSALFDGGLNGDSANIYTLVYAVAF